MDQCSMLVIHDSSYALHGTIQIIEAVRAMQSCLSHNWSSVKKQRDDMSSNPTNR